MTSKLVIDKVGGGTIDLTGFTGRKGTPFFDGDQDLIELGRRFGDGEASQGTFRVMDPDAEVPRVDFAYNLPGHKRVWWTEDASGSEIWLAKSRLGPYDGGRGVVLADNEVEYEVTATDANIELRYTPFTEVWVRPEETDVARLLALQPYILNGASSTAPKFRATTEITVDTSHLCPNTNTVTMPAKTYPIGTEPNDVIRDCAETAGKVYGVVIHHAGGSHDCLQYIVETDHSTYVSAAKISDNLADWDPDHASAPVLEPHWQMGKASVYDPDELLSGMISIYGDDASVFVENPANVTSYDHWVSVYHDSESVNAAQATARVTSLLGYRGLTHVTHRVSVVLSASQVHLIATGMSIQIKAAAAMGGQYLDTWQTRRIAECSFRPRADGKYWADLHLDRPLRSGPYRGGKAQPASTALTSEDVEDTVGLLIARCETGSTTPVGGFPWDWTGGSEPSTAGFGTCAGPATIVWGSGIVNPDPDGGFSEALNNDAGCKDFAVTPGDLLLVSITGAILGYPPPAAVKLTMTYFDGACTIVAADEQFITLGAWSNFDFAWHGGWETGTGQFVVPVGATRASMRLGPDPVGFTGWLQGASVSISDPDTGECYMEDQ